MSKKTKFFIVTKLPVIVQVTRVSFGSTITVPLLSGGADLHVTVHNRGTYVNRYVEYELLESINRQFEAFLSGFKRVYNTNCEIYVSNITLPYTSCLLIDLKE